MQAWKRLGWVAAGAVFMAAAGASALELMAGDDAYFKMPDEIAPSQEVEVSFHDVEVEQGRAVGGASGGVSQGILRAAWAHGTEARFFVAPRQVSDGTERAVEM